MGIKGSIALTVLKLIETVKISNYDKQMTDFTLPKLTLYNLPFCKSELSILLTDIF